jgi:hypothetical protein
VEVDDHYEPPAAEAGACKAVQRDTQWKSARSGTRGCSSGFPSPFQARPDLLPSHIPSETVLVGRTPELPRGPLFIFRKIHLYGKTKKSTHGHQTTKPFCTHFFFPISHSLFQNHIQFYIALLSISPARPPLHQNVVRYVWDFQLP